MVAVSAFTDAVKSHRARSDAPSRNSDALHTVAPPDARQHILDKLVQSAAFPARRRRDELRRCAGILRALGSDSPREGIFDALSGYLSHQLNGGASETLAVWRRAVRLAPGESVYRLYLAAVLSEAGKERSARQHVRLLARHWRVDLKALTGGLRRAGFEVSARTLLDNGFPHPRNTFESCLRDRAREGATAREPSGASMPFSECVRIRKRAMRGFRSARVPHALRGLMRWAKSLGTGDDLCRTAFLMALDPRVRVEVARGVRQHARSIQEWLDGFGSRRLSREATAFMYLSLAVEEATVARTSAPRRTTELRRRRS